MMLLALTTKMRHAHRITPEPRALTACANRNAAVSVGSGALLAIIMFFMTQRKQYRIGTLKDAKKTAISALGLVARLRAAVGDPEGRLMQEDLITHCAEMHAKARRLAEIEAALGRMALKLTAARTAFRDARNAYENEKNISSERIEAWEKDISD